MSSPPSDPRPIARYWKPVPSSKEVICELCPHHCRIAPGKKGFCRTRLNREGELTIPYYGRFTSLAVDPIEKKPLYHFFPASSILSIGTAGCNLSCRFCQNWSISQEDLDPESLTAISPEELVQLAKRRGIPAIAFTYNEPSIWAEFLIDAATEARRNGIRTVAVTNGMISGEAAKDFYRVIDGVNIDLKAFTDRFYRSLCGGDFQGVQKTIRYVARETDCWLEVTNLVIPGYNDSPDEITALVDWLLETAGEEVPIHFSAFFPTFHLTDAPRTPPETLYKALEIAQSRGILFPYVGNIRGDRGESTLCPNCGETVISRNGYRTVSRIVPETSTATDSNGAVDRNVTYSFRTPETTVGGYRLQSGGPEPESVPSNRIRGVCPRCHSVIPGRFF